MFSKMINIDLLLLVTKINKDGADDRVPGFDSGCESRQPARYIRELVTNILDRNTCHL